MSENASRFKEDPGLRRVEPSFAPSAPEEDLLTRVQRFAASRPDFATLSPALREIAVKKAAEMLGVPDEDLLVEAGEDARVVKDPLLAFKAEHVYPGRARS